MLSTNANGSPRILYYGAGWPTNIGNAFIDLGAMALLHAAAPNAQISFASEMPRWLFGPGRRTHAPRTLMSRLQERWSPRMSNALDLAACSDCDVLAFAGMAMCEEFVKVNGPTILQARRQGVSVLLMGTGGFKYTKEESRIYWDFLQAVQPTAFISRDDRALEDYSGCSGLAHRGIDCAFFVADAFSPLRLKLDPYVVLNFDDGPEPPVDAAGRLVLRSHHACWNLTDASFERQRTLISDVPHDYLTLYAGAEEVHSDRVHACVAALSYGRAARLYHPTPRGSLFEAAGAAGIRERLTRLNPAEIASKKQAQVEFVRGVLAALEHKE
jgi:hypothetical protein